MPPAFRPGKFGTIDGPAQGTRESTLAAPCLMTLGVDLGERARKKGGMVFAAVAVAVDGDVDVDADG